LFDPDDYFIKKPRVYPLNRACRETEISGPSFQSGAAPIRSRPQSSIP